MAYKGIDVSSWQGDINWKKVKAAGITAAIIRYADGNYLDKYFDKNMKEAKAVGIHIGAYIFSRASSDAKAKEEAKRLFKASKKYSPDMPLYIDLEASSLSKNANSIAASFLKEMDALGGRGGIYANLNWFSNYIDPSKFKDRPLWIAQYYEKLTAKHKEWYGMWQYSSKGKVSGIDGNVDMNHLYIPYWEKKEEKKMGKKTADKILDVMRGWIGYSEANGKFKKIIDIYNSKKPLPVGYKVKYSDEWCDTCISAAAIMAGCDDLIGRECGVGRHIAIFKKKGIWKEDGRLTPKPGWIIVYNWNDSTQPNDSGASHIGIVEKVSGKEITVIEGNKGEAVARRKIPTQWGYIRGYAAPRYDSPSSAKPSKKKPSAKKPAKKSITEIAKEVIRGKWGNGLTRKLKLKKAGYNYDEVQKKVNQMLRK